MSKKAYNVECIAASILVFFDMTRYIRIVFFLIVFAFMTILGRIVMPVEDRVLISRSMRLSFSAVQVCFLCALYGIYLAAKAIYSTVTSSRLQYKAAFEDELDSLCELDDKNNTLANESVDDAEESTDRDQQIGSENKTHNPNSQQQEYCEVVHSHSFSVFPVPRWVQIKPRQFHAQELVAPVSQIASETVSLSHEILFNNEYELSLYVFKIHAVGLALWETYLCFDCTSRDIDISFLYGIITGWICRIIAQCNSLQTATATLYAACCYTILISQKTVLQTSLVRSDSEFKWALVRDVLNLVILPFCTGIFWTLIVPAQQLVHDAKRSLWTVILISVTFPLYWTVIDQAILQNVVLTVPHNTIVFILICEPVLKTFCVFLLLWAIQQIHTLDFIVSLVVVVSTSKMIDTHMTNALQVSATVTLVLMHLLCIVSGIA